MKEKQYTKIIDSIRADYRDTTIGDASLDYVALTTSVRKNVQVIGATQQKFDSKRALERNPLVGKLFLRYADSMFSVTGNPIYGRWSSLFDLQLTNVNSLNTDLTTLIRGSDMYLRQLSRKIAEAVDGAKERCIIKNQIAASIPAAQASFEDTRLKIGETNAEELEHYDQLKEYIAAEHSMLHSLGEVALTKSVHTKELEKIEFLRRHAVFHSGTIFSAKKLAITTKQICDTLKDLKGVYEIVQPIGMCLEAIHEGLGTLRGYTEDLNQVYQDTFRTTQRINHGENTNLDLIPRASNQLNPLLEEMLYDLEAQVQK